MATATSRIVRSSRMATVRIDTAGRVGASATEAVEMSWMSK